MIEKNPDSKALIEAYSKLIEEKSKFDIEYCKQSVESQKSFETHQRELNKAWIDSQALRNKDRSTV
jgi:hypothetical protein